jgi:hypothetical protein
VDPCSNKLITVREPRIAFSGIAAQNTQPLKFKGSWYLGSLSSVNDNDWVPKKCLRDQQGTFMFRTRKEAEIKLRELYNENNEE